VLCSATGTAVQECSLNRALRSAIKRAKIEVRDGERLSWHSLRHSAGSFFATDLELPATTLARLTGHTDPGFTLRVYARDTREQATVNADVLARAAAAGVGA
jgi:integrase